MHEQLKAKLSHLHEALAQVEQSDAQELDQESKALLSQLDSDIQNILQGQQAQPGLSGRLEQQAVNFDGQHPSMSAVLRDILDVLAKMGI